jgi:hypothetical protein
VWVVTLGFARPVGSGGMANPLGVMAARPREYKRIRIDANTGDFLGMEIRTLPTPDN